MSAVKFDTPRTKLSCTRRQGAHSNHRIDIHISIMRLLGRRPHSECYVIYLL